MAKKIQVKKKILSVKKTSAKPVKVAKKSAKSRLTKTAKSYTKVVKTQLTKAKKVAKMDALDQLLLKITAKPYNKFLKQIKIGKKKLSDERKLALQLGTRILEKAKEVRDSLIVSTSKQRNK